MTPARPPVRMQFSVVIPTFQRRDIVLRTVAALERQLLHDFEVIVVVDGSADGTADALRRLDTSFPLTVVEQRNAGAAAARNAGAALATGDVLLFLDDDMEAHPALLLEHERCRRAGADLVLGDLPLHPESPRNLLSWGVGFWARSRLDRLAAVDAELPPAELLTGQLSVTRAAFESLGGFDAELTRDGLFGGEDVDFGHRATEAGLEVVFTPAAVSYQYYAVDPADYLERARETGRAEYELAHKHPALGSRLAGPRFRSRASRWLLGPFVVAPRAASLPLRTVVVALARSGRTGWRLRRLFFAVRTMEHLSGARAAERAAAGMGSVVVLAYHAVADSREDPVLGRYAVSRELLAEQLDALAGQGHRFVDMEAVLGTLAGRRGIADKAMLVTFDDAYADLGDATAVLAARRIPAAVFAVSRLIGRTNEWDHHLGALPRRLLDADGLRALADQGVEVGAHGATHRPLPGLARDELDAEVVGSATDLVEVGLPRPRVLAYPHGEWSPEVRETVRRAGYAAAFTVRAGVVRPGDDPFALPRVEVLASDTPWRIRVKVATAGWPAGWRQRLLRVLRVET